MNQNVFTPVFFCICFLVSSIIFKFLPREKKMEFFNIRAFIAFLLMSIYCFIIAIISYLCNLDDSNILILIVVGVFSLDFIIMTPAIIRLFKINKKNKNED